MMTAEFSDFSFCSVHVEGEVGGSCRLVPIPFRDSVLLTQLCGRVHVEIGWYHSRLLLICQCWLNLHWGCTYNNSRSHLMSYHLTEYLLNFARFM